MNLGDQIKGMTSDDQQMFRTIASQYGEYQTIAWIKEAKKKKQTISIEQVYPPGGGDDLSDTIRVIL